MAMHKGRPLALDNHNQLSASLTALAADLAGWSTKAERAQQADSRDSSRAAGNRNTRKEEDHP